MANTIRIKRRPSSGSAGSPSAASLYNGELAFNENDNTLYYAYGSGVGGISTAVPAIAGSGAYSLRGGTNASGTWPISVNGNSASVTDGVYTTGTQTINGLKTFGNNTTFNGYTAVGGGRGGGYVQNGTAGGSGGGGGGDQTQSGGAGTPGQGNAGGNGLDPSPEAGGGGGGAGAAGQAGQPNSGGAGGAGLAYSISGTPLFYAGGGSGGTATGAPGVNGTGGSGVGGNGGGPYTTPGAAGQAGSPFRGSGGGAGNPSAAGSTGQVVIKYLAA